MPSSPYPSNPYPKCKCAGCKKKETSKPREQPVVNVPHTQERKTMKTGDTVTVQDGSYSMSLIKGRLNRTIGHNLRTRKFRMLAASGKFPTDRLYPASGDGEDNDAMLVDQNDPDFVLFTQKRFCRVVNVNVNLAPEILNLTSKDGIEITIPRGAKRISLILQ